MSQKNENLGVAHGEDVYLIYCPEDIRGDNRPYNTDEKRMSKFLLDMYVSPFI